MFALAKQHLKHCFKQFKIIRMILKFYDRLDIVRLTSILEHWWMWDYLNAPVSGDAWIIIQPFFRRLEPQAAAVSRRKRGGGGRWWKWGEGGGGARVTPWGEKGGEWNPLENLSNQRTTNTAYTQTHICWAKHTQSCKVEDSFSNLDT